MHNRHRLADDAPKPVVYEPAAQAMQRDALVRPKAVAYFPGSHGMHGRVDARAVECVPAGHWVHASATLVFSCCVIGETAVVPLGQAVQLVAPLAA
jgi:hypothetical protein